MGDVNFSWGSFFVGLMIGMLIMFLIVLLFYWERWGWFNNCSTTERVCGSTDYYTVTEAVSNGYKDTDILAVSDGKLLYRRVPKSTDCRPGSNQTVVIDYPQWCEFTVNDNNNTSNKVKTEGYLKGINPNEEATYILQNSSMKIVNTNKNCETIPDDGVSSGIPIAKWTIKN